MIRDYQPDDDIRQVNWRATARLGRPMSNQYRLEQDRDLLLLIDAGRLSTAPLGSDGMTSSTPSSTPPRRWPSSPTSSATAAAPSPSTTRSAPRSRRAAQGGQASRARALRPRAAPARQRLRARVPPRRGLQARAGRRLHRPARGVRGAPAGRRRARCSPAATRSSSPARRTRRSTRSPQATRRPLSAARATIAHDVLDARARAAAQVRAAGARVLEAPPDRLPALLSPPTCGPRRAPSCERSRPRHTTSPQKTHEQRRARAPPGTPPAAPARWRTPPGTRTARATARSPRPSRPPGSASRRNDVARRSGPGRISAQPDPQPGDPADDDAGDLQRPVRGDQPQERHPVARADREPADHAQDQPVEEQRPDRQHPEGDPAHEREQRHLDVVGHHLERERRGGRGVEVAALGGRVGGGLELARDQPGGRRRVDQRPRPRRASPGTSSSAHAASTSNGRSASRRQ